MEKDRKASTVTEVVGESGCRYSIQKVLQQQEHSDRQVYLAWYELLELNQYGYLEAKHWLQW